ncbi:flagellar hook-associated protein FlgK [Halobacillus yeomjeoni]|uniref:flagellar hook-associated protein FlgK n=1 Tax=Halobacillus yeomjeoni TaxID=311194 RepID=UPI001CD2B66D|nr:flagellar hook-associated protein FlgK [Halobacillus yeomjeoni]MCA0984679.1 flagellar hook-associated protein FlgK [Halobacillus yeomjeoni]
MVSTFHGLEVAKRGLFTQQSALYTTGHNISNANTEGYTRQRVNFEQTSPYPAAARNRPEMPGQIGQGVQAGTIERVREEFIDVQFRNENHKVGFYESISGALEKMEEVMNEPSEQGLSKTMDRFWQSLQDLAVNPENSGARSVVRQRGIALAETFNYLDGSLKAIQKDMKNEINVVSMQINSLSKQINSVNHQIGEIEPHGYVPNDLYDQRDRLLDEMSKLVNIDVSYSPSSTKGSADPLALGKATVRLANEDGTPVQPNIVLVDGKTEQVNDVSVSFNETRGQTLVNQITVGDQKYSMNEFKANGKLTGLMTAVGYMGNTPDVEAYTISESYSMDGSTDASLPSKLHGETLTISGTRAIAEDPGYQTSQQFSVTIEPDETLKSLADKINNSGQGVTATVEEHDGSQQLVLKSQYVGKEAALNVQPSDAASALGVQGDYQGSNNLNGVFSNMLANLDRMASAFMTEFNRVHQGGESLESMNNGDTPPPFFSFGKSLPPSVKDGVYRGLSGSIQISDSIRRDLDDIAAAKTNKNGQAFAGNGDNAQALADVRTEALDLLGQETSVASFYEGMIGSMAVEAQEANRQHENSETLRQSVEQQRQSVSSVSLDEEMTNMVKFQHAYNAAARNITVVDEMMDRIINQMGRVGR